ncbi:MAG: 3D-(3,5/4)-trihydroxycyclohexane-1,2-dione acylhydrolase (decyclizing) [Bacteroidetes bacterium]|nr:3D-(3,5/4)-trihydroxycyclohexane-1,2-dione acylhydrolase (decyclizing) [Bacteroidota bacterium]
MKTIKLTTAQALVKFLDNQYVEMDGVENKFIEGVFGIFGHGCVAGIGEALQEPNHSLKFYQGHSEQGMGHAAIAFAKQSNRRRIMAVTSSIGPGALNMVTAAGTATVNRIPVLFLPGDNFACRQPDPVLQQVENSSDYTVSANDAFKPVCRFFDRVNRPDQLMLACINAMRVLTDPAEAGAVCLAMPQDVQGEAYDYPLSFFEKKVHRISRRPMAVSDADQAADIVMKSKKPMIICGGGVRYSEAGDELALFAEKFGIPFGETQAGKGTILWDHPMNMGGTGVCGTLAANTIAHEADVIIAVGTRLNDFVTGSKWNYHNPDVKIISLNVNNFDAYKMNASPFLCDAREGLQAMGSRLTEAAYFTDWENLPQEIFAEWKKENDRLYSTDDKVDGFTQTKVMGLLNEKLIPDNAIMVSASGSLPSDMERLWRTRTRDTYHLEYGFSCMGYEIAGALGVKIAEPEREVFCLVGDGSYLMLNSEMFSSIQEGLKINIILIDNNGFHCIDNLQASQGIPHFGCEFRFRNEKSGQLDGDYIPVDYAMSAKALGFQSWRVENSEDFTTAVEGVLNSPVSTLIDCKTERKSMTDSYSTWWRVGTPEVSEKPEVVEVWKEMKKNAAEAKQF